MLTDEIREIIADALEITPEEVDVEARLEDLMADELSLTDIASSLEDQYSIEISEEALDSFKTVEDVISFVEANLD
ncbi:MAG: acyl carrier protein [Eubacterium sp.]|nr:acyl carrier protein [Eubacterium sp.]